MNRITTYEITFTSAFNFLVLGLGLFFIFFLVTSQKRKLQVVRLILLMIGVLLYELFINTLLQTRLIYAFPFFFKLEWLFELALYPSILLLVLHLFNKDFKLKWIHLLLYLPFFFEFLYTTKYIFIGSAVKLEMIDLFYQNTRPGPVNLFSNWSLFLNRIMVPIGYLGFSLFYVQKFKKHATQRSTSKSYYFIFTILGFLLLFKIFAQFLYNGFYQFTGNELIEKVLNSGLISLVIILLCYMIILELEQKKSDLFGPFQRKPKSPLSSERSQEIFAQINALLWDQEYYKKELTLKQLAELLEINENYISRTINEMTGNSFSDLVNNYRLAKAKELLLNPAFKYLTIEGIAQEAGFKSKSTFYRAFQKAEGLSPSAYKKKASPPNS